MSLPELATLAQGAAAQSPWVAAPILIPLGSALLLLIPSSRKVKVALSAAATLAMLLSSLFLLSQANAGLTLSSAMGAWPAPFGIVLVADRLGTWMSVLTGVSALLAILYAAAFPDPAREKYGLFAFFQFLFAGVQMSFLTGDLFNLFVAFEVMLVASYALTVLGSTREQLREGFRYIVMNLSASSLLVVTCGMLYGLLGTLNMAHLAQRSAELGPNAAVTALSTLLILVFAAKSALFPLGFWLPGTYPAVPPAVGAFFAAILTKVGVYALARTSFTMFNQEPWIAQTLLLALGTVTMLYGSFGILSQREWRRSMAFVVVASVGYLAFGLGTGTASALGATLYYLGVSVIVTTALFLLAGVAERMTGTTLVAVRGMLEQRPALAAAFLFMALTVAGLPPTGGFIAKFALVQSAFTAAPRPLLYLAIASALISSLLILYGMIGIWRAFFWGRRRQERPIAPLPPLKQTPMYLAAAATVGAAVFAGPLTTFTANAAQELAVPSHYIGAVLGEKALRGEDVVIPPAPTEPLRDSDEPADSHAAEKSDPRLGPPSQEKTP